MKQFYKSEKTGILVRYQKHIINKGMLGKEIEPIIGMKISQAGETIILDDVHIAMIDFLIKKWREEGSK